MESNRKRSVFFSFFYILCQSIIFLSQFDLILVVESNILVQNIVSINMNMNI